MRQRRGGAPMFIRSLRKPPEKPRYFLLRADRAPFGLVFSVSAAQNSRIQHFALQEMFDRSRLGTPLSNHQFMPPPSLTLFYEAPRNNLMVICSYPEKPTRAAE